MAGASAKLLSKLEEIGLGALPQKYISIFEGVINMQATMDLHVEAFQNVLAYMEEHVARYSVELPESTSRWVPLDFIKHIYNTDSNFRFRLARFLKGLTRSNYRVEDDDVVFNLGDGPLGNAFLSWDMTVTLFLNESQPIEAKRGKAAEKEVPLVHTEQADNEDTEETLSDQVEASMALMLLQQGDPHVEEPDRMLDPEEVIDMVPEFDVTGLYPIIVDGIEFLFLDDICKSLGLREDEGLCIIATGAGGMPDKGETSQPNPPIDIDFSDHDLTKALAYRAYNAERTMEDNAATALVAIQDQRAWYESIPDSAFHPHKSLTVSRMSDKGSIDIAKPTKMQMDDDIETAFAIDRFAARRGGVRASSEGRDSSLWNYLPGLSSSMVRVFHLEYSDEARAELAKCKALSITLCDSPLTSNANKCILVSREAALYSFAASYTEHVLTRAAASLFKGESNPSAVASTLGNRGTPSIEHSRIVKELLDTM